MKKFLLSLFKSIKLHFKPNEDSKNIILSVTYYDILGVEKNATDKQIEDAYKFLSAKYHPDNQGKQEIKNKAKRFDEIVVAYNTLSDKIKRKEYDKKIN